MLKVKTKVANGPFKTPLQHGEIQQVKDAYAAWVKRRGITEPNKHHKHRYNSPEWLASKMRNKEQHI